MINIFLVYKLQGPQYIKIAILHQLINPKHYDEVPECPDDIPLASKEILKSFIDPEDADSLLAWLELRRQVLDDEVYLNSMKASVQQMTAILINFTIITAYFIISEF
jgi:hypothetical protein